MCHILRFFKWPIGVLLMPMVLGGCHYEVLKINKIEDKTKLKHSLLHLGKSKKYLDEREWLTVDSHQPDVHTAAQVQNRIPENYSALFTLMNDRRNIVINLYTESTNHNQDTIHLKGKITDSDQGEEIPFEMNVPINAFNQATYDEFEDKVILYPNISIRTTLVTPFKNDNDSSFYFQTVYDTNYIADKAVVVKNLRRLVDEKSIKVYTGTVVWDSENSTRFYVQTDPLPLFPILIIAIASTVVSGAKAIKEYMKPTSETKSKSVPNTKPGSKIEANLAVNKKPRGQ